MTIKVSEIGTKTIYTMRPTQHTNELSEEMKVNLTADGVTFEGSNFNGKYRGYVRVPLFGMASRLIGPVILSAEDLEL